MNIGSVLAAILTITTVIIVFGGLFYLMYTGLVEFKSWNTLTAIMTIFCTLVMGRNILYFINSVMKYFLSDNEIDDPWRPQQ